MGIYGEYGWVLYVACAAILFYMWDQLRAFDHDKAIDAQNKHHVRVHKALKKHPKGGTWKQYKRWMNGRP